MHASDEMRHLVFFHSNRHVNTFRQHLPVSERVRNALPSYSCVIDLLELEYIMSFPQTGISALKRAERIPLTLGIAFCHPADSFCYKTGREVALRNMKKAWASLTEYSVSHESQGFWVEQAVFEFHDEFNGLMLIVSRDSRKPYFRAKFKTYTECAAGVKS